MNLRYGKFVLEPDEWTSKDIVLYSRACNGDPGQQWVAGVV